MNTLFFVRVVDSFPYSLKIIKNDCLDMFEIIILRNFVILVDWFTRTSCSSMT